MGRTSDARERLVESGASLIRERGYNAVGVSELCARAGVNKGSFYHFFPSKEELASEVIDRFWEGGREELERMVSGDLPPLEALARYFEGVARHHREAREACGQVLGCPLGNLGLEMSSQSPQLRQRLRDVFDRHADYFERVVAESMARGEIPAQNARRSAFSILALFEGKVMLAKMRDDPAVLEGLARDVRALIGAAGGRD